MLPVPRDSLSFSLPLSLRVAIIIITKRPNSLGTLVSHGHVTAKPASRPNHHYKCINSLPLGFTLFFSPIGNFFVSDSSSWTFLILVLGKSRLSLFESLIIGFCSLPA